MRKARRVVLFLPIGLRRFPLRFASTFLSFCALFIVAGCGGGVELPPLASVSGKVTNGGEAVANANVVFTPVAKGENQRPSSATTDSEGNYELMYNVDKAGAVLGQHTATLELNSGGEGDYEEADNPEDAKDTAGLPARASDGSIKMEVKEGTNDLNIEVSL